MKLREATHVQRPAARLGVRALTRRGGGAALDVAITGRVDLRLSSDVMAAMMSWQFGPVDAPPDERIRDVRSLVGFALAPTVGVVIGL